MRHFVKILIILLLKSLLSSCQDLDYINHLNDLDRDDEQPSKDIHDMFGEHIGSIDETYENESNLIDNKDSSSCNNYKVIVEKLREKLESYLVANRKLEEQFKSEKELNINLKKKHLQSTSLDVESFYHRLMQIFWTTLDVENGYFPANNEPLMRYLQIKILPTDFATFENTRDNKVTYFDNVDLFFRNNILRYYINEEEQSNMHKVQQKLSTLVNSLSSTETWVQILWWTIFVLLLWCFWLFLRDIQRELRWGRLMVMIILLIYGISCIYHYQYTVKIKYSERQNFMLTHSGRDIPQECQTKSNSYFQSLKTFFVGQDTTCEKYYEYVMTEPSDQISPMVIVAESLTFTLVSPLEHVGANVGKFFEQVYANSSWLSMIAATFFLPIIFVVPIFVFSGYGIYLPFWLGSIRPASHNDNEEKCKKLIQEAEQRIAVNNQKTVDEAKQMLLQVSETARESIQSANKQLSYPTIVEVTTSVIAKHLEELIGKKFKHLDESSPIAGISSSDKDVTDTNQIQIKGNISLEEEQILTPFGNKSMFLDELKKVMNS